MNVSAKLFILNEINKQEHSFISSLNKTVKKPSIKQFQQMKSGWKDLAIDNSHKGDKAVHLNRIPSSNLPQIHKMKLEIKPKTQKNIPLPKIKSLSKIILKPLAENQIRTNQSFENRTVIMNQGPIFYSFPKKKTITKMSMPKRKDIRDLSVSSWGNEHNNILWTLPEIHE